MKVDKKITKAEVNKGTMSFYKDAYKLLKDFDNLKYLLGLVVIPNLGRKSIYRLLNNFPSFSAIWNANPKDLLKIKRIKKTAIKDILKGPNEKQIKLLIDSINQLNAWLAINDGKEFPTLLSSIIDPPFLLFGQGDYHVLDTPSIAVVGSRNATSYGKKIAFDISYGLASNGITIVSGLALGIDTQAHKGAIFSKKGKTIAVLGCGLDFKYPKSNLEIREQIVEHGAIVTEYLPGTRPDPGHFPDRNRLISGLSLGVVVVEASKKSGSLITAYHALEQGREVFAIPGSVCSYKSSGTHWLIKQGASLVENAEDVLNSIPFSLFNKEESSFKADIKSNTNNKKKKNLSLEHLGSLTSDEKRLYEALEPYSQHIDDLSNRLNMPVSKVGALLVQLELKDLVISLPGQMYQLK